MMDNRHEKIFATLQRMAEAIAPVAASRHAAAIVYKNEILAFGVNQRKTHPFQRRYGKNDDAISLHAETDAVQRFVRQYGADLLKKSSIYVLRVKWTDTHKTEMVRGMSKPCEGCARCLAAFGLRDIYYTTNDGGYECL